MPINREQWVSRHNPKITSKNENSPLSLGNGEFAYTADFTGFQNFINDPFPLCTMSQWGWHEFQLSKNRVDLYKDLRLTYYPSDTRKTGYMVDDSDQKKLYNDLRVNPHRLNLARIFLSFEGMDPSENSSEIKSHISNVSQTLDLWNGALESHFLYKNKEVLTRVHCDPHSDTLSFMMNREDQSNLSPVIAFPYASPNLDASDWKNNDRHSSSLKQISKNLFQINRKLDSSRYLVILTFPKESKAQLIRLSDHSFKIESHEKVLIFTISFSQTEKISPSSDIPSASSQFWNNFWTTGGAVSLEGTVQAKELERRIVLSRYLTAIQCSGSLPPQETGLTANSWYGKFHLEMHPWHAAQFALWGNPEMLDKSLSWYISIAETARKRAAEQGFKGLRWPKMTDPSGLDSPSSIGTLLCWQQPHFIFMAELLKTSGYSSPNEEEYRKLIYESADFMADYALKNENSGNYELVSPLIPAQENHAPEGTRNPLFELEYWYWGLKTAILWKQRNHEAIPQKWLIVKETLAPPPISEGGDYYLAHQNCPETFDRFATDHPSFLLALGFLPENRIDKEIMKQTLKKTVQCWNFSSCWGWDFPVMAMTAARLDESETAVDFLLMKKDKNFYGINGQNAQIPKDDLPLYLPGNGSLLLAIALMAGGNGKVPSFPENWKVKIENMKPYPF